MSHDDFALLRELGFAGTERQLRAGVRLTGLMLCLTGGLLLAKQFGWWPEDPRLWAGLAMLGGGIFALTLARKPARWLGGS